MKFENETENQHYIAQVTCALVSAFKSSGFVITGAISNT